MCLECDGWTDDEIYDHYDELIATYASRGLAPDQRALQVVLPADMVGPRVRRWQPCLDLPDVVIDGHPDRPSRHLRH